MITLVSRSASSNLIREEAVKLRASPKLAASTAVSGIWLAMKIAKSTETTTAQSNVISRFENRNQSLNNSQNESVPFLHKAAESSVSVNGRSGGRVHALTVGFKQWVNKSNSLVFLRSNSRSVHANQVSIVVPSRNAHGNIQAGRKISQLKARKKTGITTTRL